MHIRGPIPRNWLRQFQLTVWISLYSSVPFNGLIFDLWLWHFLVIFTFLLFVVFSVNFKDF